MSYLFGDAGCDQFSSRIAPLRTEIEDQFSSLENPWVYIILVEKLGSEKKNFVQPLVTPDEFFMDCLLYPK